MGLSRGVRGSLRSARRKSALCSETPAVPFTQAAAHGRCTVADGIITPPAVVNPETGTFDDDVFPASGHITSTVGHLTLNGHGENHPGTDIGTGGVYGGPVRTPHGGTVVRVGTGLRGYGN